MAADVVGVVAGWWSVVMSVARLSAGAGYQYLMRHTACGDVGRDRVTALTSYYAESGYPPGTWWGAGLDGLGPLPGAIAPGTTVTEDAMARVFGAGHDPVTDLPLGRPYPQFKSRSQRVADAIGRLPESLAGEQLADAIAAIERAEAGRRPRTAVAGFDLTFTAPKSASVLWALADPATQALVVEAHQAAVRDALALVERRALFTRVGARSSMQVPTRGMVAALFEHWDTRTGDPNLHTHVVIANRVQGLDGQWRTLDSRALHHAVVAVSEVYDNLLADHLAVRLPVTWERRDRGPRRTPAFELHGLPDRLLTEFSQRSAQIDQAMIDAVADFRAARGRGPNGVETSRLRQRLTRQIRPPKTARRLSDLIAWWRDRASAITGVSPQQIVAGVLRHRPAPSRSGRTPPSGAVTGTVAAVTDAVTAPARHVAAVTDAVTVAAEAAAAVTDTVTGVSTAGGGLSPRELAALAATTLAGVMERRSTWTRWNVLAEAARATRDFRCASPAERHALHDQVVEAALAGSVILAAPELFTAPTGLVRADGVSVFDRAGEDPWTHPLILEAEARLLDALDDTTAPTAEPAAAGIAAVRHSVRAGSGGPVTLAADQAYAVTAIAASGRRIDVLVGPAGTGKTTTLAALRTAWEAEHGPGTVLGLAPSATAAHELAAALGIGCENTAKWIHESTRPAAVQARERRTSLTDFLAAARAAGSSSGIRRGEAALRALEERHGRWSMRAGMLVIVDEASLAGTLTLDTLATQACEAGAKLLLVGDQHQLSAVDAGGAFGLLASTPAARELTSLWRFQQRWEADATRRLRHGDPAVADTYEVQGRLHVGGHDEALDAAYSAWAADLARGEASLLLAADTDTVTRLNQRARHDRIATGDVDATSEVTAADGIQVGVGDVVLTRRNNRGLLLEDGSHVRNGTRWTVTATHLDGGLTLTTGQGHGGDGSASVRLPATYVREHVELGYAATIHRAQGVTVTHSHVIAAPGMTREALYVAMTRGTTSNHAYLPTDGADPHCENAARTSSTDAEASERFASILATSGREKSATETLRANLDHATSPARLLPIRDALTGLDDDTPLGEPVDRAAARRAVREIDALLRNTLRPAAATEASQEKTRQRPVASTERGIDR
ncbi:MAG: MobF family relaxase [Candidatus Nanopelagicales bacterium]